MIKLFAYANSHPRLWKVGMIAGAHAARWFIKDGKIPLNIGAIGEWTQARDLPQADGESFRSWFKNTKRREINDESQRRILADIAKALGRDVRHIPSPPPVPVNDYAHTRLTELDAQQRCDAFIEFTTNVMLVHCELTTDVDAPEATLRLCERYGREPVLISGDDRLAALGITARLQEVCDAVVWDSAHGEENIRLAEQAKVGVVYAEYGLTESGGVVLFSAPERGRAISLLPESSILSCAKYYFATCGTTGASTASDSPAGHANAFLYQSDRWPWLHGRH